jgi:hypothetical protein
LAVSPVSPVSGAGIAKVTPVDGSTPGLGARCAKTT